MADEPYSLFYLPFRPALDANGIVVPGASLTFYLSGTNTLQAVYADAELTTPLANPLTANAAGKWPAIYIDTSLIYRVVLRGTLGETLESVDPYTPGMVGGPAGSTGPADNTYTTYAALLASDPSRKSARLVPQAGETEPAGNFNYINGAWVRQTADSLTYRRVGGLTRPAQAKLDDRVTTSDFPTLAEAVSRAAGGEVIVNTAVTVTSDVTIPDGTTIRFAGGKIVVPNGATITDAVLRSSGGRDITLINPTIDASATAGVHGIRLFNVNGARIERGLLTKCRLDLESGDNTVNRAIYVSDLDINLAGYLTTGVYFSNIRGVTVRGGSCIGGLEGYALYNGARSIRFTDVVASGHTQDGFLINQGQDVRYVNCGATSNGQSGFTTQRQTAALDSRVASWVGCKAELNVYDGFDIRGANTTPWGLDTAFELSACTAIRNGDFTRQIGCGFYVVNAEGTTLTGCVGILNNSQNLCIDHSNRTIATGFRSISGANSVPSGVNKAGILIYNSNSVQIVSPTSGNWDGVTQDVGVAFTGTSMGGRVMGGDLSNNTTLPFVAGANAVIGAKADTLSGVFFKSVSEGGLYEEECVGVPTHTRPNGSIITRRDPGFDPEIRASRGGGVWKQIALVA